MRAMASQSKWCLRLDSENKLTVLLNRLPMRKPNGEEYSHVTFIERGNSAIQVKLFKTLQGPAFSTAEKERYLRLALDTSLVQAGVEAEREKKIKSVQKTFVEQTTCVDWQEAKELYPEHTNEAVISKLADFKVQRETIPKTLIKHIESAKADMPLAKEPEIDLKVYRGGVEVDISTFPEMIRLVNKTKLKIGKLLNKTIAANED